MTSPPIQTKTASFASGWKDQLASWNGQSVTYDHVGNMTSRGSITYGWTRGKCLETVSNGHTIQYEYDHNGIRTKKTVDGVATEYHLAGNRIISQKQGNTYTYFSYDSNGMLAGMTAGGNRYFYIRNIQGDIIGLIDENAAVMIGL